MRYVAAREIRFFSKNPEEPYETLLLGEELKIVQESDYCWDIDQALAARVRRKRSVECFVIDWRGLQRILERDAVTVITDAVKIPTPVSDSRSSTRSIRRS